MRAGWVLVCLLSACGDESVPQRAAPSHANPPGEARPSPEPPLIAAERRLMGTVFVVRAAAHGDRTAALLEAALDEIARLEGVLSEWRETSEISAVNAAAGVGPVRVSDDTLEVVGEALRIARISEGAFDPTWAALRGLYDFNARQPVVPDPTRVQALLPLVRWQDVSLDIGAHTIRLARRGMALGTGGIAKGYALDRAAEILLAGGVRDFMIYGGGQVQVHGRRGSRPFRVGIQHPRENRLIGSFEASDGSISTSGDYEHAFFDARGQRVHHIVDPATGMPARKSISVTVVSARGIEADALSTAVFVLGAEAGFAMIQDAHVAAEIAHVDADCVLRVTPSLRERIHFDVTLEPGDVVPGCRTP